MSGALWFYFWDEAANNSASAQAALAIAGAGGGLAHTRADEYPIDWESLWDARETYLKSRFAKLPAREVQIEPYEPRTLPTPSKPAPVLSEWPDPILKPRRKRAVPAY